MDKTTSLISLTLVSSPARFLRRTGLFESSEERALREALERRRHEVSLRRPQLDRSKRAA